MADPAIIWDVDGTLVDTAEQHFRAWSRLAAEIGRPFTRPDFAATFGMRNPEIIRALFAPDAELPALLAEVAHLRRVNRELLGTVAELRPRLTGGRPTSTSPGGCPSAGTASGWCPVRPCSTMFPIPTAATNQWHIPGVYLTDGRLAIDDAPAERAIRPLAIGRKNRLHIAGEGGLSSAA